MSSRSMIRDAKLLILLPVYICTAYRAGAQTAPAEGIRINTPAVHALTNARIIQSPGRVIQNGTLVIRDGIIQSVGTSTPPKDARIWNMKGMTIYPGLIDSYSEYGMPKQAQPPPPNGDARKKEPDTRGAGYWNPTVLPQNRTVDLFVPDPKTSEKLRTQGFTSALVVPPKGIFKGLSALISLGDGKSNELILQSDVAHHIFLGPDPAREGYPTSLMGAIALIRQTLYDADWYQKAHAASEKNPALPHPETSEPLNALKDMIAGKITVIIETSDEQDILRADKIAREFSLPLVIRGSGNEYKRLDAVRATHRAIILPVNFPDVPSVGTPEEALDVSLSELRHWDEAPENPQRIQEAGIQFAFTSATLKDPGKFLVQVRKAIERGLSHDAALAALTTTPARIFGVEKRLGSLEPGKIANLIVTSGNLFAEKTIIRETWVDGKRYEVKPLQENDPRGTWNLNITGQVQTDSVRLAITGEPESLQGTLTRRKEVKLSNVTLSQSTLSMSFKGDSVGYNGIVRMSAMVEPQTLTGTGEWSSGAAFTWSGTRIAEFSPAPDTTKAKQTAPSRRAAVYPFGEFGRPGIPDQPASVLVKGATIWTCGPAGKLENADLLIQRGKVTFVGKDIEPGAGTVIIDGKGKHVTPGIIDPHSHMAIAGSVNEAGQAITAEVRVADVIDPNDIDIYRALAGGLTEVHALHGSANPIGGQCQLVKLRWGALADDMKFDAGTPTIKFALGENVKQSNWGDRFTSRYPQTRMGVEQIMRDEFSAALNYEKARQRYEKEGSGIPPRRDLELDAILEVLKGTRAVHCHAYRQDEILTLLRLAEEFGFKIQVLTHILEGYKVADIMAKHGSEGSSFSDWWAYKLEVYDAIPYNGALMHDQGVLVSFNSDSDELARRLNLEAAKAVKYGGVPEQEALKFVTINPAKQLNVDHRVGSLEPGKDADFVLWNGHPLSTYTLCEQTWIDGRKYFDRAEDRTMNEQMTEQRAALIQKALATRKPDADAGQQKPKPMGKTPDGRNSECAIEGGRE